MGNFGKIAMGLNVLAVILVLVALIVDSLTYYEFNFVVTYEVFLRSTKSESEASGVGSSTSDYSDCCDDGDGDNDCCDLAGRGVAWIIFNVVALICGVIAAAADFGIAQVSFGGISNKFVPIIAAVCVLLAILIWEIDNPVYDVDFIDDDDISAAASIWLAAVGLICFIAGGVLEIMGGTGTAA